MSRPSTPAPSSNEALSLLTARGIEFDSSRRRLAEYSSDASNYRVLPTTVVFPRHADEILEVIEVARETGTPITARGGGTSVAGNAVGSGIILEMSRYLTRIHSVDPASRTAVVDPGVVQSDFNVRQHRTDCDSDPTRRPPTAAPSGAWSATTHAGREHCDSVALPTMWMR